MCQFLSAIVLQSGEVLTHPMLDSHADIIKRYNINDTDHRQRFAKVELIPDDWMNVDTWTFKLDEDTKPDWWDDIAVKVESTLRTRSSNMILRDG